MLQIWNPLFLACSGGRGRSKTPVRSPQPRDLIARKRADVFLHAMTCRGLIVIELRPVDLNKL